MRSHVGDGCGLRGRPGGSHRSRAVYLSCGTAGNKPPADLVGGTELTAGEGPGSGDRITGAAICRRLCLKYGHDPLSAVGCPTCDDAALGLT